jgi:dimethylargininase
MLTAITRAASQTIVNCQLTYLKRLEMDASKAIQEQLDYERRLVELGVQVVSLPNRSSLPDSVFIEDTAVILDEIAIIAAMGAPSRRQEIFDTAEALSNYRPLKFINQPGTLEGGDVMRIGRRLYVGESTRTNSNGISQMRDILRVYDYDVINVEVDGCLHLSTGCTYIGRNTILSNRNWIHTERIQGVEIIDVYPLEPWAANALLINGVVVVSKSYPKTRTLLEERGFKIKAIDISELEKAEAGLTCLSLLFQDRPNP